MILRRLREEERGTTIAELVVGIAMGSLVLFGLTTLVVSTLHTTTRVSQRVEATQHSRLVITRLIDELDSACVMPKLPPVQPGSSGSVLRFVHASGSEVTPTPTLSVVSLEGTTLFQADYALKEGSPPHWVFQEAPSSTVRLMNGVEPISASRPVFSYYAYGQGGISTVPQATPLSEVDATTTLNVGVALKAAPTGAGDNEETPAHIEDSASLRLTASAYNENAVSLPCQ